MLQKGDYICKRERKDAYFFFYKKEPRKYVRFQWKETLYEYMSFLGLGPAPLILTKILKVPIFLLRRPQICLTIYLDDMLLV